MSVDSEAAGSANPASLFDEMTESDPSRALVPVGQMGVEEQEPESLSLTNRNYSGEAPQFGRDEVMVPRLRLAQGLTSEVQSGEAHPGEWVLTGAEAMTDVRVTPVMFSRARELRSPDDNTKVLCASPDAIQGVGSPGGVCESCPKSQWTDAAVGKGQPPKRNPPECVFIYSYICWSHSHQSLVVIEFKRTAVNVAKLVNTMIATKGLGNFAVTLKSQPNKGPKGTYFVPQAAPSPLTDEEHQAALVSMPTL